MRAQLRSVEYGFTVNKKFYNVEYRKVDQGFKVFVQEAGCIAIAQVDVKEHGDEYDAFLLLKDALKPKTITV